MDQNGNAVAGTSVLIRCDQDCVPQKMQSDEDRRFGFNQVPLGAFQLTRRGDTQLGGHRGQGHCDWRHDARRLLAVLLLVEKNLMSELVLTS